MARREPTPLRRGLARMLPKRVLNELARSTRALRRRRRVDLPALLWVLVLQVDTTGRSIAGLRRAYEQVTGVRLSASAFYDRFTPVFGRFVEQALTRALAYIEKTTPSTRRLLGEIRGLVCVDATVVRLHDALERAFPGSRTNHSRAAAKLHAVMNVAGRGPQRIRITAERVQEGPTLRAGRWVRGLLLLFDLGYCRYQLFDNIDRQGGFFLTRLKKHANPSIVKLHRRHRGQAIAVEGRGLQEVKGQLRRSVFDAEAEVDFRRRSYRGQRRGGTARVRIVGLRNDDDGGYHWYLTNLPPESLSAEEVGKIYALRWTVELLFRELKQCYHLAEIPSRKPAIVRTFLHAAVLTLLASRALLRVIEARCVNRRIPIERWARLFGSAAPSLLLLLLDPAPMARSRERKLLPWFLHEAPDPNRQRRLLADRAPVQWAA